MDRQRLNRLNYLRKNLDFLNQQEQEELQKLEYLYRLDAIQAQNQAVTDREKNRAREALSRRHAFEAHERQLTAGNDQFESQNYQSVGQDQQYFSQTPLDSSDPYAQGYAEEDLSRNSKKGKKVHKSHRPKRWLKWLVAFVALVLVAAGGIIAYMTISTESALKKTYVETGAGSIDTSKPLVLALMGVDTGDASRGGSGSWNGNSDSQIIMILNPKTDTTTMVSMERDTMTNILDQSGNKISQQKMNAAYAMGYAAGGLSMASQYAMATYSEQIGIPISNFVVVNMDGLVNLVNDVGGIDVVNDSGATITIANTEPEYTATVPYIAGNPEQHINGDQALVFSRDRDTLPNGDYGRAAHQREVIAQIVKKLISLNTLTKYDKLLNDISGDFKTNIKVNNSNLLALLSYRNCFNKTVSVQYQGVAATAAGSGGTYASYQFMPTAVDLAVQNLLRKADGLSTISELSSNVITYQSYYGKNPYYPYYMPSATVTEKNKTPVVYGVNSDGEFVPITSSNAGQYASTTGTSLK